MNTDDVKILLTILVHIPLAFLYRAIPSHTPQMLTLRKAFGALVGVASCLVCFPVLPLLGFFALCVFYYFLSLRCVDRRTTFYISFVSFLGCCLANLTRLWTDFDGQQLGIDVVYLVLTPKIIYFNWFVNSRLQTGQRDSVPSLFDYFCYVFNFIGILTTPVSTPLEYDAFIRQAKPETSINWPRIWTTVLEIVCWTATFLLVTSNFDLKIMERKEFLNLSLFRQIMQVFIEGVFFRSRYIIAWKIAYIHAVAANLRYIDDKHEGYVDTVDGYVIATSCSPKAIIDSWNMSIQRWLKECFYLPSIELFGLSNKRASLFTLATSAFWHGFFPTYYFAFFGFNYMSQTEKLVYQNPALGRWFPALYHRFILDLNAGLFKRTISRQWIPYLWNVKYFYLLNFVVYNLVKVLSRKMRNRSDAALAKGKDREALAEGGEGWVQAPSGVKYRRAKVEAY